MIKKFLLTLCFIIVTSSFANAQQIYFCQSYTEDGQPVGASNRWEISRKGGMVYILLQSDSLLADRMYYLFIDKEINDDFDPFDSKVIRNEDPKNYLIYNYTFKTDGKFKVYFVDSKQKVLAEEKVIIEFSAEESEAVRDYSSSLYYDNVSIVPCERVIAEKPMNIRYSTSMKINNGLMYVYIENDRPLNTKKLLVDVWRKDENDFEYNEFITTKKFKTEPTWNYTFFKYFFPKRGDYKITVYSDKKLLIGSTYIKVR